ncbi:45448_t:CDS:2, partial [Gigaspora margarita]
MQHWNVLVTSGNLISIERHYVHCVSSKNGIYVYGGFGVNDMIRSNVSNLIWSTFSGTLAPSVPVGYSATSLNDTSILYIGGGGSSLDKLPLYNINDNTWSFSSQYNQILMFYGSSDTSIWTLDTLKFVWSVASISNIGGSPTSLFSFASTLVGAYILIGFGKSNDSMGTITTNGFFLLDVSQKDNYKWVTTYDPTKQLQTFQPNLTTSTSSPPSNSSSNSSSSSNNSSDNIATIIGGIFGGLAGVILTIVVLVVKRYGHSSHPDFVTLQEKS